MITVTVFGQKPKSLFAYLLIVRRKNVYCLLFFLFLLCICNKSMEDGGLGGKFWRGKKKKKSFVFHCIYFYLSNETKKKKKKETQVSPPPAHAVQEKIHFLISLPTLSNQDRDLHKGVLLSAPEYTESSILLFAAVHEQWR